MKKNIITALIALTGVAAFTTAKATPVTWVGGDVLLGIEDAAHTKNLLIDLGAGASLASSLTGGTFSTINILSDLNTTFGTNWSSASLNYGVFGLPSSKAIVYASVATGNAAPVLKASGALATTLAHYNALGAGYNSDILGGQGLTVGVYQNVGTAPDTGFATWSGNTPSVTPFATYNVTFENVTGSALDIYGTTGTTSTLEGSLVLANNGTISAVPEPGTYVLFGLGALGLMIVYRRRANA